MDTAEPLYQVNEYAPDPTVKFDRTIADKFVRYAHMLAARGYVQSTLGGMVIRVPHPNYADGLAYAKPAGVSLEEMSVDDVVITDIPYGRVLHGNAATSVGHQMNREILRLRPDVNCVIHLHHDETIALLAAGREEIKSFSLTFSYLMQKPIAYLPAHLNVEEDVAPIKTFIEGTNCIVMARHGITILGRTVSECYHRVNSYASEVKRQIMVELLCAANGAKPEYITKQEMEWMFSQGDDVVYPKLIRRDAKP
ncbi:MAG TPA: class II aldolase/adducin family protein [Burkholderiales bacterium]|jgi:ribulose-5-phosphate 4-epimerase/fuculose-1-phosphate aldolase